MQNKTAVESYQWFYLTKT